MWFHRNMDTILGTVLLTISGILLTVLIPLGVKIPKSNKVLALSPDFWIKIIVWSLLVLSIHILVRGLIHSRTHSEHDSPIDKADKAEYDYSHSFPRALLGAAVAVVGLFAYYFLIQWLGIIVSSTIAFTFFVVWSGERRLNWAIPIAVLLPVSLYYFFLKVASIPMPLGIFG